MTDEHNACFGYYDSSVAICQMVCYERKACKERTKNVQLDRMC